MAVRRLVLWLAVPLAIVAALALGHRVFRPEFRVEANSYEELLGMTPIPRPELVRIRLERPDGSPAAGAVAVMLEPELAIAYADAGGEVALQRMVGGPVRLQAYLPGHELLRAPALAVDPTDVATLRFAPRIQPQIPELAPEVLVRHDLTLRSGSNPLSGVKVIGRLLEPLREPGPPLIAPGVEVSLHELPWVAFAEEDGRVRLEGLPRHELRLRAYPLTLPEDEAWVLAERRLQPSAEGESAWNIPVASLQLEGMPSETLLRGWRLNPDAALPLRRVPDSGTLDWPVLPPGDYRFQIGDDLREYTLRAGSNRSHW